MPVNQPNLQRRTGPLSAWFVRLDDDKHNLLVSGRFRLLLLSTTLLLLLLVNLAAVIFSDHPVSLWLLEYSPWLHGLEIVLLLMLFWEIWRVLLLPLPRLGDCASISGAAATLPNCRAIST